MNTTVASNPYAIGYVSIACVNGRVKSISVDGVTPSNHMLREGTYAVKRPFILVTNGNIALSETAQSFFDFATPSTAAEIIEKTGVVAANRR